MSGCGCSVSTKLVFPCSGAADVGAMSDLVARKLTQDKIGKMSCLAGIGGKVSGIIESTKAASKVLVIDGCPLECAKKTLNQAGLNDFVHLKLNEEGFKKGHSEPNEANISQITQKAMSLLACE